MTTYFVRTLTIYTLAVVAGGFAILFDEEAAAQDISRPRDPWVFAGALDERPRVLYVALDHDLWVAYDTQLGDVYKAFRGALQPAVADPMAFSPWPATVDGLTYLSKSDQNPWQIIRNGDVSAPQVFYRGYRITGERLTLQLELFTESGHRILVEERPEVVFASDGRPGLQREFFVHDAPAGYQVALAVEATTLRERSDVKVDGVLQRTGARTHSFLWGKTYDLQGRLILKPDGVTTLTTFFAPNLLKNLEDDAALDPLELFKHTRVYQSMHMGDESNASTRLMRRQDHVPGVDVKIYGIGESIDSLMQLAPGQLPTSHKVEPAVDLTSKAHFGGLDFYFITQVTGFFNIPSEGKYSFQVLADDGVRFAIADRVLYEHDGLQAATPSEEIQVDLKPGVYPFTIEHFQSTGRKQLTLMWKPPWRTRFEVVRAPAISTEREEQQRSSAGKKHVLRQLPDAQIDVAQIPVDRMHPGIAVETIDLPGIEGIVGGMDLLSDGRLVLSTWNGEGRVYIVEGLWRENARPRAHIVAKGLAFPFGVKAVDDEVFVLQRHELTQLIDLDGDGETDEYRVVADGWPLTNDFDELSLGLVYREGEFYGGLAMPIDDKGAILIEEIPDRGQLVRLGFDGEVEPIAGGFQVPNGIVLDDSGILAAIDHRNPWFSDSRLVLAGNSRGEVFAPAEASQADPLELSTIWLPSGSKSEAPTQPIRLHDGPFSGQWIYGDLSGGRLNRVFVEEVEGALQGAVFRFTGGLEFPINRLAGGEEGTLIAGVLDFEEPWRKMKEDSAVLQRITITDDRVFEMNAVRVQPDGFEIQFTGPVNRSTAGDISGYRVFQWNGHDAERRRRRDRNVVREATVRSVQITGDGTRVKLGLSELQAGAIYYINLDPSIESVAGGRLWSNEAWYTLNELPGLSSAK